MTFARSEQLLLDTLRVLPPQCVYADAERKEIVRGFQLFIDHRVRRIGWEESAILVLEMSGRGPNVIDLVPVTVRVFRENHDLRSVCSCGGTHVQGRCEHMVCAFVTLLHLLKPNLFKMTRENPAYRAQLRPGFSNTHPWRRPRMERRRWHGNG